MTAAQYLASARRLLPGDGAAARFLALAGPLERAAGPGHFLESSACPSAPGRVKLASILAEPAERLAADERRRDEPAKEAHARGVLRMLSAEGGYDAAAAGAVLDLLRRWRLRGSLMTSLDYERGSGFGKLSFYGYLPDGGLPELARALDAAAPAAAGPDLAFFGADFTPEGTRALKLYHKSRYARAALPEALRPVADGLSELGALRDVTRLTRAGGADKVYVGYGRGPALGDLARLKSMSAHADFLAGLARDWPDQRAWFVGWGGEGPEVYFDRRPE